MDLPCFGQDLVEVCSLFYFSNIFLIEVFIYIIRKKYHKLFSTLLPNWVFVWPHFAGVPAHVCGNICFCSVSFEVFPRNVMCCHQSVSLWMRNTAAGVLGSTGAS